VVAAAVSAIERARVLAVEVAHPVREVGEWGLDDEVVVVAHEAARVHFPAVATHDAVQDANERVPVGVVDHNRRVVVARGPDVVVGACNRRTEFATHRVRR
jgi:hypothetical protein